MTQYNINRPIDGAVVWLGTNKLRNIYDHSRDRIVGKLTKKLRKDEKILRLLNRFQYFLEEDYHPDEYREILREWQEEEEREEIRELIEELL